MSLKENLKIKVAVLYGGRSAEHEVSQQSAASIIENLDKNKFDIIPVLINKEGRWLINESSKLARDECLPIKTTKTQISSEHVAISPQDIRFCDVVFPVLHGSLGEDGTIQGFLETLGLPFVGAGVLGSALGMDKAFSKRLAKAAAIPVIPFLTFNSGQWQINPAEYKKRIQEQIHYPLFVKPANTGSSLGISKVKESTDLIKAIECAFQYDTKIIIEKALDVREIEMAVLENLTFGAEPLVSIAGEIIPNHEFYTYEAKYLDEKGAEFIIPPVLKEGQLGELKDFAAKLFVCLACEGMARVDFFIEKSTQKIYFNELNTIPGFTKISMYPTLWKASGLSYQQLLTHLIDLALLRYKRSSTLKRSLK